MLILNFKITGRPSIFIATNSWPVFLRRCHHDATFVQLKSTGRTKQQQYQSQWNSNRITEKGQNRFIHLERRFRSKLQNISGFFTSFKFTYCLPSKYFMSHSFYESSRSRQFLKYTLFLSQASSGSWSVVLASSKEFFTHQQAAGGDW